MKLRYSYFLIISIIIIIFMLYTSRNHIILYEKIKSNDNLTDKEKNDVYTHGQIHLLFAFIFTLWVINVSTSDKSFVFYISK